MQFSWWNVICNMSEAAMERQSRQRVALKVGAVFAAGLMLFIVQFGVDRLPEVFFYFTMPFGMWTMFIRDGVHVVWFSLAVLMLASVGVCLWRRRLLWMAYLLIAVYWFWTYAVIALSF